MKGKASQAFNAEGSKELVVYESESVIEMRKKVRSKAKSPLIKSGCDKMAKDINFLLNWQINEVKSKGVKSKGVKNEVEGIDGEESDDGVENMSIDKSIYKLSFLNKINLYTINEKSINIKKSINISKKNFYKLTAYLFHITTCLISDSDLRVPIFYTVINLLLEVESKIKFDGAISEFLANYQLIGLSVVSISFKYFCKNLDKILFTDLIKVSYGTISADELKECEIFILKLLNFSVHRPIDNFYIFTKNFQIRVLSKFKLKEAETNYLSACLVFYSICKLKTTNETLIEEFLSDKFKFGKSVLSDISNKGLNLCNSEEFKQFIKSDDECQIIIKKI